MVSEHTANLACWLALWNWFTLQLFVDSQTYGFSSSHVRIWELDRKEDWVSKNWCFWTVVLEKTLESPLDCKEIQPVHPKGNKFNIHWKDWCLSWNSNTWATWCEESTHLKDPEAVKDCRWEEKGTTEDKMDGITDLMDMSLSKLRSWWWAGKPAVLQSMGSQRVGHDWMTELN